MHIFVAAGNDRILRVSAHTVDTGFRVAAYDAASAAVVDVL